MKKSGFFLVFLSSFISLLAALAFTILQCPNCDADDNWMATSFVLPEDAPKSEMDLSLSSPQLARFRNTEFNSSLFKKNAVQTSSESSNLTATSITNTSISNIGLEYIHAVPNPVKSGSFVTLTASFGIGGSNPPSNHPLEGTNESQMTVNATIKNSAGAEVGKVDLKYLSGGNYVGIWKANVTTGSIMQASLHWHQANPTYVVMSCR